MLQLEPRQDFPIVRQLSDPLDTDTLYVRAYIRKSSDNTLLETVDLVDKTGQRFAHNYMTPADKSGEGTFIDISTRVFTDSGYTTESDVYAREVVTFLVKETWNRIHNPGGGDPLAGPHEPDYAGFGKIVDKRIKGIKFPKQEKFDSQPIIDAINDIHIPDYPKPEKVELGGIIRLIEQVRMRVEGLPKPERVNFTEVYRRLTKAEAGLKNKLDSIDKRNKKRAIRSKKRHAKTVGEIKDYSFVMAREPKIVSKPKKKKIKKDEKPWRKYY